MASVGVPAPAAPAGPLCQCADAGRAAAQAGGDGRNDKTGEERKAVWNSSRFHPDRAEKPGDYQKSAAMRPNQQQIGAATLVTGLVEQQIECQGRQIIRDWINTRVFFLIHQLEVAPAIITAFAAHGIRLIGQFMQGHLPVAAAAAANGAWHIPFGIA